MLIIFLAAILGILAGLPLTNGMILLSPPAHPLAMTLVFSALYAGLGGAFGYLVSLRIGRSLPANLKVWKPRKKLSLSGLNGSSRIFCIVFRNFRSITEYHYWYPSQNGFSASAVIGDVQILEEDRSDAELVKFSRKFRTGWLNLLVINDSPRYEFRVPKGSIAQNIY